MTKKRDKNTGLTPREAEFARQYVRTGDARGAAEKAGYAHAGVHGYGILARPQVQESVRKQQANRLNTVSIVKAVGLLEAVLDDAAAKTSDRITAAKVVLSYTLGRNEGGQDKAPEDMTADEIAHRLAALRARQLELSEQAQVIDIDANTPPESDVFG